MKYFYPINNIKQTMYLNSPVKITSKMNGKVFTLSEG